MKAFGAGSFTSVDSDTAAPYTANWDSTTAPDGDAEIRAVITDAAGNVHTTAVVIASPSTRQARPSRSPIPAQSSPARSALTASTGGGAVAGRRSESHRPAPARGRRSPPTRARHSASDFDTRTLADGPYDLRTTGYDALGNPSTPVRPRERALRQHRSEARLVRPRRRLGLGLRQPDRADGERAGDSARRAARRCPCARPVVSGNDAHVRDRRAHRRASTYSRASSRTQAARARMFRVAVTIESTPSADPPPVEKSASPRPATETLVAAGRPRHGQAAAERVADHPPTPQDYILVLRVDPVRPGSR